MQNKKPKLTIISPSLNTGEFLRETINSILSQSYNDFEYIIIDGGSTDETLRREHPLPRPGRRFGVRHPHAGPVEDPL